MNQIRPATTEKIKLFLLKEAASVLFQTISSISV